MQGKTTAFVIAVCTFSLFIVAAHAQTLSYSIGTYERTDIQHTGPVFSGKDLSRLHYTAAKLKQKKGCI